MMLNLPSLVPQEVVIIIGSDGLALNKYLQQTSPELAHHGKLNLIYDSLDIHITFFFL